MRPISRTCFMVVSSLIAIGCGSPNLSGTVTDITGNPIADATITVVGTTCHHTTDPIGAFSFPCQGGDWRIIVTAQGYISKELLVSATENIDYTSNLMMIKIPAGEGLFLFDGNGYQPLEESALQRHVRRTANTKSFCVNKEQSKPHTRNAGSLPIYDKKHGDWRLWRLNEEGCAYTQALKGGAKLSGERIDCKEQSIDFGNAIYICDLEVGDYFIANWSNGFFVESAKSTKRNRLYSGYQLIIR